LLLRGFLYLIENELKTKSIMKVELSEEQIRRILSNPQNKLSPEDSKFLINSLGVIKKKKTKQDKREKIVKLKQQGVLKHDEEFITNRRKDLLSKRTPSELEFGPKLKQTGFKYLTQFPTRNTPTIYFIDFYIPKYKLAIEIDGGYHNKPEQIRKDKNRTYELGKYEGITVIRFTNKESNKLTVEELRLKIEACKPEEIKEKVLSMEEKEKIRKRKRKQKIKKLRNRRG
jgi:very-short-patch-repair endonuclease